MKKNNNLKEQAQEIIKMAEKYGVESNFFFLTTFKRYSKLLEYLEELEEILDKEGMMTEKMYIKGVTTSCVNPALIIYNKTCAEANRTINGLLKIIKELRNNEKTGGTDPLLEYLSGRVDTI